MAKLERVTHKLFAENAPIVESGTTQVEIGQFGSALAGTYVATNDVATLQALPAYTRGWGGAVIPNSNFPTLEDMNAVQKVQSYQTGYLYQEGIPEYDANTTYYAGSVCKIYQDGSTSIATSLIDENTGNPLTDINSWAISPLITGNVLRYNQITNCITEIPQRVKLELVDGTLTLKSGSIVTVPNGFEADGVTPKFDEITIESDISFSGTVSTNTRPSMWFLVSSDTTFSGSVYLGERILSKQQSGTSTPSDQTICYYNTDENIIYFNGSTGGNVACLPLCIATLSNGVVTSIDQVFNGFGYIGLTIWVDKGVKGLIPDGRNEDGSLKNIEITTQKVEIRNFSDVSNFAFILAINSSGGIGRTSVASFSYDNINNFNYSGSYIWDTYVIGEVNITNSQITSLQTKLPFRAVDYSSLVEISEPVGYPNYGAGISKAWNTQHTADQNGWIFIAGNLIESSAILVATINGVQFNVCRPQGGTADSGSGLFPVKKGDTYKGSGGFNVQELKFYPNI